MNQTLTTAEIEAIATPIKLLPPPKMTKRQKLIHLAGLIHRKLSIVDRVMSVLQFPLPPNSFVIFHGLEYMTDEQLARCYHPGTVFDLAAHDPAMLKAGLKRDVKDMHVSALEAKRFFELAQNELHEFSCNCGGVISNDEMARRIESIAARS